MRINLEYIKKFIDHDYSKSELKELLASIGIEVDEMIVMNGKDIFEVEITPNRPDWLSHYGIAREINAKNTSLNLEEIVTKRKVEKGKGEFEVIINDTDGCSRYSGVILNNVKVEESSSSLKHLIESFGLRTVNNIVDISNLILMTYGHPIHIFDLEKISGNKILIRNAEQEEELILLNGERKKLDSSDLVIADAENPIALAGVMGGESSGVTSDTVDIFIESAWFDPSRIRKTSRKFGMKTDASYLFERGADIKNTNCIIDLTIQIIFDEMETDPDIIQYLDLYPVKHKEQFVLMDKNFPNRFTGIKIPEDISLEILRNLGFKVKDEGRNWNIEVPSFRVDIHGYEDIVEEIIRIYGYDKLDSAIPKTVSQIVENYKKRGILDDFRHYFMANGYSEVINYSFHMLKDNSFFGSENSNVEIKNPIGSDFAIMRNSLISGILKNTATNFNNDFKRISLFESGTVFSRNGDNIVENDMFCISSSGFETLPNWKDGDGRIFDFFLFKSQVIAFLNNSGFPVDLKQSNEYVKFFNKSFSFGIEIAGSKIGFIGEIDKSILNYYKIINPVYICQIDLDSISVKRVENKFKLWNKFPSAIRDLSFLSERDLSYNLIGEMIEKHKSIDLEEYSLTDLYEGKDIPKDKVSMLMNFRYRSTKRTLTNDEVNDLHNTLTEKLVKELGIIRR